METTNKKKIEGKCWMIRPCTNLHVGNENVTSYGLVDKMVQRDVVTALPCIHASSLKGALSEYIGMKLEENPAKAGIMKQIFGCDNDKPNDFQKGNHVFYDAHLLFLPVPSDHFLYCQATSPGVLRQFIAEQELLGFSMDLSSLLKQLESLLKNDRPVLFYNNIEEEIWVGDYKVRVEKGGESVDLELQKELKVLQGLANGREIVFFSDHDFTELCNDENLPIIARNRLGKNKNLWYEQVVPRESVFYTFIQENGTHQIHDIFCEKDLIQIGANATIGYGYCRLNCINKIISHEN